MRLVQVEESNQSIIMTFAQFINDRVIDVVNGTIIPGIFALAFLAFIWGVFRYVFAGDGKNDIENARQIMIWGIIVIAIMVSLWGILRVFKNTITTGTGGSSSGSSFGQSGTMGSGMADQFNANGSTPPQEGFTDWMLNCFGACRDEGSEALPGDLNLGSDEDEDLPGSSTPF